MPELTHREETKKQEHKWPCLAEFNEVLNFPVFFLCDGRESCEGGNCLSVGNLRPSRASVRLDCQRVGLLETLCCIGRLRRDESLLTGSFGCTGSWKEKLIRGKLCLRIPHRSRQFDVALMSA